VPFVWTGSEFFCRSLKNDSLAIEATPAKAKIENSSDRSLANEGEGRD
jgi:hypothetical protein